LFLNVRFEVFLVVTMENAVFWDMALCGFCRIDVLEECIASIFRMERISELGRVLAVTSNCCKGVYWEHRRLTEARA
jgi:hypothetical protein